MATAVQEQQPLQQRPQPWKKEGLLHAGTTGNHGWEAGMAISPESLTVVSTQILTLAGGRHRNCQNTGSKLCKLLQN